MMICEHNYWAIFRIHQNKYYLILYFYLFFTFFKSLQRQENCYFVRFKTFYDFMLNNVNFKYNFFYQLLIQVGFPCLKKVSLILYKLRNPSLVSSEDWIMKTPVKIALVLLVVCLFACKCKVFIRLISHRLSLDLYVIM